MSNLKPAPLGLTESVVAKMLGDRPPFGTGVIHVPIAPFVECDKCGQLRSEPCTYSACPIAKVQS